MSPASYIWCKSAVSAAARDSKVGQHQESSSFSAIWYESWKSRNDFPKGVLRKPHRIKMDSIFFYLNQSASIKLSLFGVVHSCIRLKRNNSYIFENNLGLNCWQRSNP